MIALQKQTIWRVLPHVCVRYLFTTIVVNGVCSRRHIPPNKFRSKTMKSLLLIPALAAAFGLSGCVVTPPTVRPAYVAQPAYVAPPGVVYVQPTYASPGPGWVWEYHSYYGWGWHHPHYGWHRGWR
jgi:hypothetical protein